MATGPKSNWGGARPGAGRKPQTLSGTQVRKMLSAAKKLAAAKGKTIDDILLGFIYDDDARMGDRLAAIKLWKEYTVAKLQEGGETDKSLGPQVYLPEPLPDPAKVVPIKDKDKAA